jgi:pyruvate,water dikinase
MVNQIALNVANSARETAHILWLETVGIADVPLVGGKNASLGEMIQHLAAVGIDVPKGFATTAAAYRFFIEETGLDKRLRELFATLDTSDVSQLHAVGTQAREAILRTPLPLALEEAITRAYAELCGRYGNDVSVAVRSSATAEDLPDASFAGQQESFLHVRGIKEVVRACHKCIASLFTDRAISYRHDKGFDHFEVALAIGIQKMVESDSASAGVMFSIDPETGFRDAVLITGAYGLGENVVQGAVNPDEYLVFKKTLDTHAAILDKKVGSKERKLVCDREGFKGLKQVEVSPQDRLRYVLDDGEILQLARWAVMIESHYSQVRGMPTPMDIEWAKDGRDGRLYVVQARPETVQSQKTANILKTYILERPTAISPLTTGRSIGEAIGQGNARIVEDVRQMALFRPGEVLVTGKTDPDWEPIMKVASAIVTDRGGKTCHAAIIARELGIPTIVGCGNATQVIPNGQPVTVSCADGETGNVYDGLLPYRIESVELNKLPLRRVDIMANVGNPEEAFKVAALPVDGVGLARLEFIIANHIKVHPLALIHFDRLTDDLERLEIEQLTQGFDHKPAYFVERLARGIAKIAAAFYPRSVIVRTSDFKSNEYANLLGGKQFEPSEENPMLGWRGASRYYAEMYRDAFGLECIALKIVRDEMGLKNVIPMIPFCRTPEEGQKVLSVMEEHGLKRGKNDLKIYVMCELPSNIILADRFCEIFDGMSIGSNDLTQLTLGLDRDSELVAHLFDERNEAVKLTIEKVIKTVKQADKKIGICGQAPSDYPEFARFLIDCGIDSISLNPDSVLKTIVAMEN